MGAVIIVATGLSACSLPASVVASPSQSPQVSVTAPSVTPSATTTTASPTPTPSSGSVKATGRMSLFQNVTKALVGTCEVSAGKPVLTLSDKKNDFFGTVDVTITLAADGGAVSTINADFGEDSELITRKLSYTDKPRVEGTSAVLVAAGGVYTITGKAMVFEDQATTGSLIPFSIKAKCASSDWLG